MSELVRTERALCICQAGCVRSVAVAYLLKFEWMINAVAIGMDRTTTPEDWRKLLAWATVVFTVSDDVARQFEEQLGKHGLVCERHIQLDIGEDRWGLRLGPYADTLLELAHSKLTEKYLSRQDRPAG